MINQTGPFATTEPASIPSIPSSETFPVASTRADFKTNTVEDLKNLLSSIKDSALQSVDPARIEELKAVGVMAELPAASYKREQEAAGMLTRLIEHRENQKNILSEIEASKTELEQKSESTWHKLWTGEVQLLEEKEQLNKVRELFSEAEEKLAELNSIELDLRARKEKLDSFIGYGNNFIALTELGIGLLKDLESRPSAYQDKSVMEAVSEFKRWESLFTGFNEAYSEIKSYNASVKFSITSLLTGIPAADICKVFNGIVGRGEGKISCWESAAQIACAATLTGVPAERIINDHNTICSLKERQYISYETAIQIACTAATSGVNWDKILDDYSRILGNGPGQLRCSDSALKIACTAANTGQNADHIVVTFRDIVGKGENRIDSWDSAIEIACAAHVSGKPATAILARFKETDGRGTGQINSWEEALQIACCSIIKDVPSSHLVENVRAANERNRGNWKTSVRFACAGYESNGPAVASETGRASLGRLSGLSNRREHFRLEPGTIYVNQLLND